MLKKHKTIIYIRYAKSIFYRTLAYFFFVSFKLWNINIVVGAESEEWSNFMKVAISIVVTGEFLLNYALLASQTIAMFVRYLFCAIL